VPEEYLLAHMREKHGQTVTAQLTLFSDGTVDAIVAPEFTMTMSQILGLLKFVEVHIPADLKVDFSNVEAMAKRLNNVRSGPWVH
jgi:hypothetical protein